MLEVGQQAELFDELEYRVVTNTWSPDVWQCIRGEPGYSVGGAGGFYGSREEALEALRFALRGLPGVRIA